MNREDPLAALKGIVWAIPLSILLWGALVAFALAVSRG
jgi:hypothetical protein